MRKIIFRLDDVCPDMDYEKFARIRDIFIRTGIRPLMGVIPCNKDSKLKDFRGDLHRHADEEIWKEIQKLQNQHDWEIALHGYEHLYKTSNAGIMNLNSRSEFAGMPYEDQLSCIRSGLQLLTSKGLKCIAFMAPAHSFDEVTIKVLSDVGLPVITDGKGLFPYRYRDCVMMPVPYSIYKWLPFGIYTICIHPNIMKEEEFHSLEMFVKRHRNCVLSFSEGLELYNSRTDITHAIWSITNMVSEIIMMMGLKTAQAISGVRHMFS